jgi:polyvinyl alcohol dehydrogenase (cytochrome)
MPNKCPSNPPIANLSAAPAWNDWGVAATNGRFQSAKAVGLAANQVSGLKLKWTFGFPGATAFYGHTRTAHAVSGALRLLRRQLN